MNLALKQILDRYSACTLDLLDAEVELRGCLADKQPELLYERDGIKIDISEFIHSPDSIAVLTLDRSVRPEAMARIREKWESFHEGHKTIVLQPGMIATKEYEPTEVCAKVGNFDLTYDPCDKSKYSATFDGEKIRQHRKLEVILEAGHVPVVRIEYFPIEETKSGNW